MINFLKNYKNPSLKFLVTKIGEGERGSRPSAPNL